jgi:hypothetical protein
MGSIRRLCRFSYMIGVGLDKRLIDITSTVPMILQQDVFHSQVWMENHRDFPSFD